MIPVPVPKRVKLVDEELVVSPGGFGLPISEHVHEAGQGCEGVWGAIAVVTGPPTLMLANDAVPVFFDDPESTARPPKTVAGMFTSTVDPGIRV